MAALSWTMIEEQFVKRRSAAKSFESPEARTAARAVENLLERYIAAIENHHMVSLANDLGMAVAHSDVDKLREQIIEAATALPTKDALLAAAALRKDALNAAQAKR